MANKDWPFGLQAIESLSGETPRTVRYPLKQDTYTTAKYATIIYQGAPVDLKYQATIGRVYLAPSGVTNTLEACVGVAAEFYGGSARHGTKTDLADWTARDNIFAIQSDNTTTTSNGKTKIGMAAAIVNQTLGSTVSGISKAELDWSSISTNADKMLRIQGVQKTIGESHIGQNVKFIAGFNFGHYADSVAAVTLA